MSSAAEGAGPGRPSDDVAADRAPLGGPAEAEVPHHDGEPVPPTAVLEDTEAYALAVEDGAPLAPGAGEAVVLGSDDGLDPEFREPGGA